MNSQEIQELILQGFRASNSKPDHILDERWLRFNLYDKLNPKEQLLVDEAISNLEALDYLTTSKIRGAFCMVLTANGYEQIYPIDENEVIEKIGNVIKGRFAELNSKPNHIIDQRWISHSLTGKLNPREQDLIDNGIKKLVNDGVVETDERNGSFCLVLTQSGFDEIY